MRIERIAYRFTRGELSAVLGLMNVCGISGTDILPAPCTASVMTALKNAGVVIPAGDRVLIDRTLMLILTSASGADSWLAGEGSGVRVVLQAGKLMCVLTEIFHSGLCALTPARNADSGREAFIAAARRARTRIYTIHTPSGDETLAETGPAQAARAFGMKTAMEIDLKCRP